MVLALDESIITLFSKQKGGALPLSVGLGDTTILNLVQRALPLLRRAIIKVDFVVVIVRLSLLLLRRSTLPRGPR